MYNGVYPYRLCGIILFLSYVTLFEACVLDENSFSFLFRSFSFNSLLLFFYRKKLRNASTVVTALFGTTYSRFLTVAKLFKIQSMFKKRILGQGHVNLAMTIKPWLLKKDQRHH